MKEFELSNEFENKLRAYENHLDLIDQTQACYDYAQSTRRLLLERQLERYKKEASKMNEEIEALGKQLEKR